MEPTFLGVDIGGTKVAAGLVDARGRILAKARVPMVSREDAAAGLRSVESAITAALQTQGGKAAPAAIGISSPGPLDPESGVVLNPPNLPCWRNFPLVEEIQKAHGLPTHVENDANAAALAEALWGAGAGFRYVFYATLGTGIGTGLVLDGRIYHGRTGAAVEAGHISIDYRGPRCGCGKRGCIEALASGPAMAQRARERLAAAGAAGAKVLELAGGDPQAVTAAVVAAAWRGGDPFATGVVRDTADLLAIWLGDVIDVLEPQVIIFGGGMGELFAEWFEHIRAQLPQWSINSRCREIPLLRAHYGEDSGIAGAAALCLAGPPVV